MRRNEDQFRISKSIIRGDVIFNEFNMDDFMNRLEPSLKTIEKNSQMKSGIITALAEDMKLAKGQIRISQPSVVKEMDEYSSALYRSGYYKECSELRGELAIFMMHCGHPQTQISGHLRYLEMNKKENYDWYEHIRRALKLATTNNLITQETTLHYHLMQEYNVRVKSKSGGKEYCENARRHIEVIILEMAKMNYSTFKTQYGDYLNSRYYRSRRGDLEYQLFLFFMSDQKWRKKPHKFHVGNIFNHLYSTTNGRPSERRRINQYHSKIKYGRFGLMSYTIVFIGTLVAFPFVVALFS